MSRSGLVLAGLSSNPSSTTMLVPVLFSPILQHHSDNAQPGLFLAGPGLLFEYYVDVYCTASGFFGAFV